MRYRKQPKSLDRQIAQEADKLINLKEEVDALSWDRVSQIGQELATHPSADRLDELGTELCNIASTNVSLLYKLGIPSTAASVVMPSGIEVHQSDVHTTRVGFVSSPEADLAQQEDVAVDEPLLHEAAEVAEPIAGALEVLAGGSVPDEVVPAGDEPDFGDADEAGFGDAAADAATEVAAKVLAADEALKIPVSEIGSGDEPQETDEVEIDLPDPVSQIADEQADEPEEIAGDIAADVADEQEETISDIDVCGADEQEEAVSDIADEQTAEQQGTGDTDADSQELEQLKAELQSLLEEEQRLAESQRAASAADPLNRQENAEQQPVQGQSQKAFDTEQQAPANVQQASDIAQAFDDQQPADNHEAHKHPTRQDIANFKQVYESRDKRFALYQDADGHIVAIDASKLA